MNFVLNLTEQQINDLDICAQLIEIGEFKLSGAAIVQVANAKTTLKTLIQQATADHQAEIVPPPTK